MVWTDIIIGVALMLTGLLVDRHPRMISGINTMSNERLAKVDLDGLKRGLRNVLLIVGAAMLLLAVLSFLVHIPEAVHMVALFAVAMAIIVANVLISKRYDAGLQGEEGRKDRRKNWFVILFVLLVFAVVLPLFFIGSRPASIEVTEESISAKGGGMYSATIPMSDITEANVLTDWPDFPVRTNGMATEKVGIGHFRTKDGEKCMLFVCVNGGPLLEIRTMDGKLYYLNCATEEESLEMIAKVKQIINVKLSAASRHCEERSNPDNDSVSWIASSFLLAMTQSAAKDINNNKKTESNGYRFNYLINYRHCVHRHSHIRKDSSRHHMEGQSE